MTELLLYIAGSYLLGSNPFAVIVGYLFAGVDVRTHGSGNAGATNVYRVAGPVAAVIATVLDVAKGAAPVLGARLLFPDAAWFHVAAGFAAVAGHILPLFAGFRGGKGVNTLLGAFAVLMPFEVILCVAIFGIAFAVSRVVSISSIIAGVSLSLIVLIEKYIAGKNIPTVLLSACIAVSLLLLFTHRANIRRLVKGEETKLSR